MFGPVGRWYVFRIHQVNCVNVVTGPGEAVLLRAAEPVGDDRSNLSGPGRLAREFGLTLARDGTSVRTGPVRLRWGSTPKEPVVRGPRVGISQGRELPLRFALAGVRSVSRPRP
jgi:DNA-3-methyladenine glycosylase